MSKLVLEFCTRVTASRQRSSGMRRVRVIASKHIIEHYHVVTRICQQFQYNLYTEWMFIEFPFRVQFLPKSDADASRSTGRMKSKVLVSFSVVSYVRFNFVKHLQIETLLEIKPHKQCALLSQRASQSAFTRCCLQFSVIFVLFIHCSVEKQIKLARRRLNWTLRSIYGELIVYVFLSFIAVLFVVPFLFFSTAFCLGWLKRMKKRIKYLWDIFSVGRKTGSKLLSLFFSANWPELPRSDSTVWFISQFVRI